jgi:predicted ATP-grasp superfamily ATP-dependent carboligase
MPKSATRPTCVVLGLRQNGLGVVRAVGREGVPVIAVDSAVTEEANTRYGRLVVCPGFRSDQLIDTLCKIGKELDAPAVLIPTTDRSVDLVSEHRDTLAPYFVHSLPSADVIQLLMDKATIAEFARREGFSIPRTLTIRTEDDLEAAGGLGFPCILKPRLKSEALNALRVAKAFRVESLDELRRIYRRIAPSEPRFVIQEWIPGPDTSLVFCLYYFGRDGECVASFGGRKLRQFIPFCGTACAAEPWDDAYVRDAGDRFFQRVGYRGFGAIEFKRSPTGAYFLVEPTVGRTEHLFALAAANGVNLPYIGYCDMAGLPRPEPRQRARPVKYLDWKRDRKAAGAYRKAGEFTLAQWLISLRGSGQYALFSWDDTGPWRSHVVDRLGAPWRVVRRLIRRNVTDPIPSLASDVVHAVRRRALGGPASIEAHLEAALKWLAAAQDASGDGGVARGYTVRPTGELPQGWQRSYPETTGYIIPTFLDCAGHTGRPELRQRAIRMADWLLSIQEKNGGIHGGVVGRGWPVVVFNTGMVLHGWCRAFEETGNPLYRQAAERAAAFLVEVQDPDGAWRRFTTVEGRTEFYAFHVLIAWSLLLAHRVTGDAQFRDAARRNVEFTLRLQQPNGWFQANGLRPKYHDQPLTHTIGYTAAGLLHCGLLLNEDKYVEAAESLAAQVERQLEPNGRLAGQFRSDWRPAAPWSCLTGNAQMAIVWLELWRVTGNRTYLTAGLRSNAYLRARQNLMSPNPGIRGGLSGSQPIHGYYGRFQYLNWAAKYLADALHLEIRSASEPCEAHPQRLNQRPLKEAAQ